MSIEKTCCVTGHRNIPAHQLGEVRRQLEKAINLAVDAGYTHFITGGAEGVDLIFGELVLGFQEQGAAITLEADIPYRNRLNSTNATFQAVINRCSAVNVVMEQYQKSCYYARNRDMVQKSQLVIGVYDGRESGGTAYTLRYARAMNRKVNIISIESSSVQGIKSLIK